MSKTATFKFQGRQEALDIIDTGGDLVGYLGTQSAECPLIGSEIQLVKKLGEGGFGAAFLIEIKGMGTKEYVAKRTDHEAYSLLPRIPLPATLNEVAADLEKRYAASKEVIIALNGGNPERMILPDTKLLFGDYAKVCLTTTETKYDNLADSTKKVIIPAGSYLCSNEQYSEFVIGILCGDLYRKGISVNFLDVFGFATCSEATMGANLKVSQYVFMERIDKPTRAIRKCIFENVARFPKEFRKIIPSILLIQILHAIATYQKVYQIQHGDLHDDNVFIEFIRPDTVFNGQNLAEANWFHYQIGKVDLYLPWVPLLAKIGDFGLSVKYSKPIVGDKRSITDGYNQYDGDGAWIPNWFSESYDMIYVTRTFYDNNRKSIFIRQLFGKMLGVKTKNPTSALLYKAVNASHKASSETRPKMDFVAARDKVTSPAKILTDKSLMGKYMKRPTEGKIVTLGVI